MIHVCESRTRPRRSCLAGPALLLLLWAVPVAFPAKISSEETFQQIQSLIQAGDLGAARAAITKALKDNPQDAGLFNLLGVVEAQQGNYREAEGDFRKAIAALPRYAGAYLNLGRLYQENLARDPGALKKGIDTYEKLLSFQPGNVEANYQCATLLMQQGAFKPSLARLARLPRDSQDHPQALAVRCADYAGLGDRVQAEAAAQRLLQSPLLTEADVITVLPALEAHKQTTLETELLEGLVNRRLASFASLRALGLIYHQQGKLDRARETLEQAAQLKPDAAPLLVELARVAYDQRDRKGALGYLAHARALDPENPGIHFFWGIVCIEENLAEEAYRALKKAVSLKPEDPYFNYALGAVATVRQDAREAIPYFRKYCELKPEDPRGRLALGISYFNAHENAAARRMFQMVADAPETFAAAHYYLGRLANLAGDLPTATAELLAALKANPRYTDASAELGLLYLKQKDYQKAQEALQRALDMRQDDFLANLNLLVLYQRTKDPRADQQAKKFEEIRKKRSESAKELLRTIEVRP
jgi:tetratricopeptide (TPR) repeat protein